MSKVTGGREPTATRQGVARRQVRLVPVGVSPLDTFSRSAGPRDFPPPGPRSGRPGGPPDRPGRGPGGGQIWPKFGPPRPPIFPDFPPSQGGKKGGKSGVPPGGKFREIWEKVHILLGI